MDDETTIQGNCESMEHLKQELLDASKGSDNPQLTGPTMKSRDHEIIVEEFNRSAEHLMNHLSDASAGNRSIDCSGKDDTSNGPPKQKSEFEELPLRNMVVDKEDILTVKLLTEKLSAALLNVSQKDDLVKQHAKVAEEAVAGWEKAENEATVVKQQLEVAVQKKATLEHRVSHLDEALKECVRQLRLARDEQERKIREAVAEKSHEWELVKSMLEGQIVQLQVQVESSARALDSELNYKLEYLETENVTLKQEVKLLSEELEVRTVERDLSTKAAETTSKQHLESIKKVAKLEAECRRLKALPRTAFPSYDRKSTGASSYVESYMDNQSDFGDPLNSPEVDNCNMNGLVSNQLKKERAVGRTVTSSTIEIDLMDDFLEMEKLAAMQEIVAKPTSNSVNQLKHDLQVMIRRTAVLEEKMETVEAEKTEIERALAQTHYCLQESQVQLMEAQMKLEQKLHDIDELKQLHESQVSCLNTEAQLMSNQIESLNEEIKRERNTSVELSLKCRELQDELQKRKEELEEVQHAANSNEELKSRDLVLAESQDSLQRSLDKLKDAEAKLMQLHTQLHEAYNLKESLESELTSTRAEAKTMHAQINSLQAKIVEEQALSSKLSAECRELENELDCKRRELDLQLNARSKSEMKLKQEDLAAAAGKLAECQKTIASLGTQLSSLATLEDFLIDTASLPGLSPSTSLISRSGEPWSLHSNGTFRHPKEPDPFSDSHERFIPFPNYNSRDSSVSSSSSSSAFLSSYPTSERSELSFGTLFSLSRS